VLAEGAICQVVSSLVFFQTFACPFVIVPEFRSSLFHLSGRLCARSTAASRKGRRQWMHLRLREATHTPNRFVSWRFVYHRLSVCCKSPPPSPPADRFIRHKRAMAESKNEPKRWRRRGLRSRRRHEAASAFLFLHPPTHRLSRWAAWEHQQMEAMLAVNAPRRKQALLSQAFSLAGINVLPFKGNRLLLVLGSSHEGAHIYCAICSLLILRIPTPSSMPCSLPPYPQATTITSGFTFGSNPTRSQSS